jgi:hypothetical protein
VKKLKKQKRGLKRKMTNQELKELCENDLYFLSKNILGYQELEENPHLEICQFLERQAEKKLLLLPRGTFKTTIGTIAKSIQRLLQNPNIRILIFSETFSQSKKFLSEIKQQLEQNEELIGLYGQFKRDPGWREDSIIINQRTGKFKEDTIMAGGVDVVRVGFHYDLIIVDDPHSQKNTNTREQIEKVKTAYKLLSPMLEPGGEIAFTGTRWHDFDLASEILKDTRYKKIIRAAEIKKGDGTIEYFFPQRLSKEYLADKKIDLGTYIYSCQFQNEPVDDENADFKKSWFKHYKEEELWRKLLNTYITIDPAVSLKEEADFTGVIINSVDMNKNWYFRKTLKLKIKPPELIKKLFEWNRKWQPVKIGIEKEKYTQVIMPFLEEEMRKRDEQLPIEQLVCKVANKELRIKGLAPRYERGMIYHNSEDLDRVDLEDELMRFPKAKTDDLSDAASMQLDIAKQPDAAPGNIDYKQKGGVLPYYKNLGV